MNAMPGLFRSGSIRKSAERVREVWRDAHRMGTRVEYDRTVRSTAMLLQSRSNVLFSRMEDWIEPGENIDPDDCMECIDTFMGQLLRVCHIMEDIPPDAKGVPEVTACAVDFESIAREIEAINNGMEVGLDKAMDISA